MAEYLEDVGAYGESAEFRKDERVLGRIVGRAVCLSAMLCHCASGLQLIRRCIPLIVISRSV
jgi:hypothetical protein